jgi:hypothetical protein
VSSFNVSARKVRNVDLPLGHRRSAFASCILSYSWLIRQKRSTIYQHFSARFGFGSGNTLTETQLDRAMNALELDRNKFLVKLQTFDRQRLHDKLRGRRSPSKAEIEALYHLDLDVAIILK